MKHILLAASFAVATAIGAVATDFSQVTSLTIKSRYGFYTYVLPSNVVSVGSPRIVLEGQSDEDTYTFILCDDNFQEVKRINIPYDGPISGGRISLSFCDVNTPYENDDSDITQTLFNNDDNYEYIAPIWGNDPNSTRQTIKGYKIVNETGEILATITPPDEWIYDSCLGVYNTESGVYIRIAGNAMDVDGTYKNESITVIYKIDKESSSIQQVSAFTGRMDVNPRMAANQTPVTVTLDENTSYTSIDLIDIAGHIVQSIPVNGETTISIDTSWLPRGVYIVKASGKDQSQDTCKIIVQ